MQSAFQTTRWTLILQATNSVNNDDQQAALAELVELNWFPLYTFLRRSGKKAHEAEDLIQGFFVRLIEKKTLEHLAGPQRGRFRNFLLVCLKNYMAGERQKSQAQRRGGGKQQLPLDFQAADRRYQTEPFHELTSTCLPLMSRLLTALFQKAWTFQKVQFESWCTVYEQTFAKRFAISWRTHSKAATYWKTKLINFSLH